MFSVTDHNFGTVARGADTVFKFEVTNPYKQDMILTGVRSSCGCTSPTLETAGGIANALPLLGDEAFLVVNGDVYCDIDFGLFSGLTLGPAVDSMVAAGNQPVAHLVMVANPAHHAGGDFSLDGQRITLARGGETLTYAGIAVFSPSFFADVPRGSVMKLYPLLAAAIAAGTLIGEHHTCRWVDVGTPQRLAELDAELTKP